MAAWLASAKLSGYAAQLDARGYTELEFLLDADEVSVPTRTAACTLM